MSSLPPSRKGRMSKYPNRLKDKFVIDHETVLAATIGGAFLDGGEGGRISYGKNVGKMALDLGSPVIIDLDELPPDSLLLELCVVGAMTGKNPYWKPIYHVDVVKKFIQHTGLKIDGLISHANGGYGTINGWLQSVLLGLPVVDAVCNIRKQPPEYPNPIASLVPENYIFMEMGVGGNPHTGDYTEVWASSTDAKKTESIVRHASMLAGGLTLARNPISVQFVKEHGIPYGISCAIALGRRIMEQGGDAERIIKCICEYLGAQVIVRGTVSKFNISSDDGYDNGLVLVKYNDENRCTIRFRSQFITLERNGANLATFPDLIILISLDTGMPIPNGEVREDQDVAVLLVTTEELNKHFSQYRF